MSKDTGHQPRNNPDGQYRHVCAYCQVEFRSDNPRTKYCTFAHKQAAQNARWYHGHRKEIILGVMLRQARKAKKADKSATSPKPTVSRKEATPDEMTPEQLMDFIRNNPGQVRPNRK